MRDIIIIAGIRPQYIKAKALYYELTNAGIEKHKIHIINTGQHYSFELSDGIIHEISLPIQFTIKHSLPCTELEIISNTIINIEKYIQKLNLRPVVVVFGDANSSVAGAIAAQKLGCKIVHIEAGARRDPDDPEHYNSKIIDTIANVKLCVSNRAVMHLRKENNGVDTFLTGDMAINWFNNEIKCKLIKKSSTSRSILVTLHRQSNMDAGIIREIVDAVKKVHATITWIVHPRSKQFIKPYIDKDFINFIPPQPYLGALNRLYNSDLLLTDSGGLAREASYFNKPILMRRNIGGWPELKEAGILKNISARTNNILAELHWALDSKINIQSPLIIVNGVCLGIKKIMTLQNETYS